MTIDDMVLQVAKITGVAPKKQPEKKPEIIKEAVEIETRTPVTLRMKPAIGLSLAKELAYCIEKAAETIGLNAVVAITDEGGRLILLEAMDDSYIASIKAAQDKAYTAAALKMPTHEALEASRGGALDGYTNGNGILMLAGGYPIKYENQVIGGIGVSGGTKDQDMMLAYTGIAYFEKRIKALNLIRREQQNGR